MTKEERLSKLRHFITCLKCEVSGKSCDDNCATQYEAGTMGEIIENLETISKMLEQEPRWIPVSEKLPEYGEEVLTCSNGGFIEIQSLKNSYGGYWENQRSDWCDLDEIVAWMPLPESYKGE